MQYNKKLYIAQSANRTIIAESSELALLFGCDPKKINRYASRGLAMHMDGETYYIDMLFQGEKG